MGSLSERAADKTFMPTLSGQRNSNATKHYAGEMEIFQTMEIFKAVRADGFARRVNWRLESRQHPAVAGRESCTVESLCEERSDF